MLRACLLAVITLGSQVSGEKQLLEVKDTGKWTVGDCLLADFSMKFHLHVNRLAKLLILRIHISKFPQSFMQ